MTYFEDTPNTWWTNTYNNLSTENDKKQDSRRRPTNKENNLSKAEGFVVEGVNQLQIHFKNLILGNVNITHTGWRLFFCVYL